MPRRTLCLLTSVLSLAVGPARAASQPADDTSRRPVVVEVHRDRFHVGDAAIGLAAGAGLGLAASGLALLRRGRPPRG
jgi:hypothetical protein